MKFDVEGIWQESQAEGFVRDAIEQRGSNLQPATPFT